MSLKNAKPGDLISASSTVYSATGADRARIVLDFLDGNGVVIESYLGSVVQATAAQRQRSVIEGITVPVGAVNTRVGVENLDDTEEATATEHMINFGPVAMAYMRPPVRSHVETMHDLTYLDGTPAEDLKPAAAGADVTAKSGLVLLQNPYFEAGDVGWSHEGNETAIVNDPANARRGSWVGKFVMAHSNGAAALSNKQRFPVEPGDRVFVKGYVRSATASATGYGCVRIQWLDAAGANAGTYYGIRRYGPQLEWIESRAVAIAPANAVNAFAQFAVIGETVSDWYFADISSALFPKNSDIDALETTNGPLHPNADQTAARGTKDLLADDAGLGNRADFGAIIGLPSTVAGYGITDAQKDLGPSNDVGQVLRRDLAGDTYWDDQYGSEINIGAWRPFDAITLVPATGAYEPVGQRVRIPNPGKYVYLACSMAVNAAASGGSDLLWWKLAVSWDGGATWSEAAHAANMTVVNGQRSQGAGMWFYHGLPTGDILLELRVNQAASGAQINITNHTIGSFQLAPRSEFALAGAALSVTLPDTRSGACAKSFGSGTTCTASTTVTANVAGGVEPVTHSWSKVSGSDSITSGATSETCTVSGTHTTADPAAQYQTVIKDTVTDSRSAGEGGPQVVASNNCTVTLSYLRTFEPVSVHVPDQTFGCAISGGACTASGDLTRSVSGGDGSYSNAWTKRSGAGSITSGATSETCTVSNTDTNTEVEGVFRCTVTDGRSASGFDDTTVTFRHRLLT